MFSFPSILFFSLLLPSIPFVARAEHIDDVSDGGECKIREISAGQALLRHGEERQGDRSPLVVGDVVMPVELSVFYDCVS